MEIVHKTKTNFHKISFQAMYNIGQSFIFSVLSFYTFYRYLIEPNEFFKQVALVHFYWQLFYLIYAYMVIYAGSVVTSKVNIRIKFKINLNKTLNMVSLFDRVKRRRNLFIISLIDPMIQM